MFQNVEFDGEINYPDSFNIRDYASDLMFFQQAKASGVESATLMKEIDKEIARAVVDDDEKRNEIFTEIDTKPEVGSFTQDEPQQEDQAKGNQQSCNGGLHYNHRGQVQAYHFQQLNSLASHYSLDAWQY